MQQLLQNVYEYIMFKAKIKPDHKKIKFVEFNWEIKYCWGLLVKGLIMEILIINEIAI